MEREELAAFAQQRTGISGQKQVDLRRGVGESLGIEEASSRAGRRPIDR
jgi:hypothetical protein